MNFMNSLRLVIDKNDKINNYKVKRCDWLSEITYFQVCPVVRKSYGAFFVKLELKSSYHFKCTTYYLHLNAYYFQFIAFFVNIMGWFSYFLTRIILDSQDIGKSNTFCNWGESNWHFYLLSIEFISWTVRFDLIWFIVNFLQFLSRGKLMKSVNSRATFSEKTLSFWL
jgi:hypothetical protein